MGNIIPNRTREGGDLFLFLKISYVYTREYYMLRLIARHSCWFVSFFQYAYNRVMVKDPLNSRQRAFVEEYLKDLNATQAAIRAGYSENTAQQASSRLLLNVVIAEAIMQAKTDRSQRTKIDADWVLERLAQEMEADVADLYAESGALKPVHKWPLIWRQGLVSGMDVEQQYAMRDGEQVPDGVITKIKLPADRSIKRLELIGKHVAVQAFKDRLDLNATIAINIDTEDTDL